MLKEIVRHFPTPQIEVSDIFLKLQFKVSERLNSAN